MKPYQMIHQIKENETLRMSFNQLAVETFGISFEKWYELGYWRESYIPYAFVNQEEVIANASLTKMELMIHDKHYKVIQIGTVMTKKNYQGQGLSRRLIEEIIEDYRDKCDFIYLFANETVLDFYPKFDFKRVDELSVVVDTKQISEKEIQAKSCFFETVKSDIEEKIKKRQAHFLDTYDIANHSLWLFYYATVFSDSLYYIETLETYIVYEIENEKLHLYDILMNQKQSIREILEYLPIKSVDEIVCHFELKEEKGLVIEKQVRSYNDDALFVRGIESEVLGEIKLPLFSHA